MLLDITDSLPNLVLNLPNMEISYIQLIFIEHLVYVRNCSKCWGYTNEQNKFLPYRTYLLVRKDRQGQ